MKKAREIGRIAAISITCRCCNKVFAMNCREIMWYSNMGYPLPKRCPECRKKRQTTLMVVYKNKHKKVYNISNKFHGGYKGVRGCEKLSLEHGITFLNKCITLILKTI